MDEKSDDLLILAQTILNREIVKSNISAKAIVNCLRRGEILTIQDLESSKFDRLQSLRNVGFKKLRLIIKMRTEIKFKEKSPNEN